MMQEGQEVQEVQEGTLAMLDVWLENVIEKQGRLHFQASTQAANKAKEIFKKSSALNIQGRVECT